MLLTLIGLSVLMCVLTVDLLSPDINGEGVVRAYTPISGDRDLGVLDFLIKVYWAGSHPQYPEGGKMTQHLAGMKVRRPAVADQMAYA